jgi:hypothetical protein
MHTHVRYVGTEFEFVEEVSILGIVDEGVLVVGADGQTVIVGLVEVTAYDTFLGEVT